jgi:hypothetical protein
VIFSGKLNIRNSHCDSISADVMTCQILSLAHLEFIERPDSCSRVPPFIPRPNWGRTYIASVGIIEAPKLHEAV